VIADLRRENASRVHEYSQPFKNEGKPLK